MKHGKAWWKVLPEDNFYENIWEGANGSRNDLAQEVAELLVAGERVQDGLEEDLTWLPVRQTVSLLRQSHTK